MCIIVPFVPHTSHRRPLLSTAFRPYQMANTPVAYTLYNIMRVSKSDNDALDMFILRLLPEVPVVCGHRLMTTMSLYGRLAVMYYAHYHIC